MELLKAIEVKRMPYPSAAQAADRRHRFWVEGAVAGIVGAIVYTVFVEAVNVVTNGAGAFFFPFRQIGAVVLGSDALSSNYNVVTASTVGTIVHFAIAIAFGILIAWLTARFSMTRGAVVALGVAAGLVFYAVNVFVVFPAAFPWFLENSRVVQSLGHAVFGGVAGAWLAWRRPT